MADETETNDKDKNFAALREKNEKLEAENRKLRGVAVNGIVAQAGLDPKDPVVSLVREKWETSVADSDDLTPDSFTEFAGTFNLIPSDAGDGGDEADDESDDDDFSAELEAAQAKSDKAKGSFKAPKSKDKDDKIKKLEADGDFTASFHEKIGALPSYS